MSIVITDFLQNYDKVSKKGTCKACGKLVLWMKARLASHKRASCPDATAAEKEIFRIEIPTSSSTGNDTSRDSEGPGEVETVIEKRDLTPERKAELDVALGKLFYRTGISFRVADSAVFRDFVALLDPEYSEVMPHARTISGALLNKQYDDSFSMIKDVINNCNDLSLITDGWTNTRGDHIVNFLVKAPGMESLFYKSKCTSGVSQTSEQVAADMFEVLEELGPEKFVSVVTDNTNVNRAAWNLIEDKYPRISAYGCAAHCVNLLVKDILEPYENGKTFNGSCCIIF